MRVWEKYFKLHVTKIYYPWYEHAPANKLEKYRRPSEKPGKKCEQCTEEEMKVGNRRIYK